MSRGTSRDTTTPSSHHLRRELKLFDAVALSLGIIGPVGGMALLGVGATGIIGRAAPLAFVFAIIGVASVAYGIVRLSRYIAHAGSVYGLVGVTLGPRSGFVAGWALFGAYLSFGAAAVIEVGLFGGEFLRGIGITHSGEWIAIALIGLACATFLAYNEVKVITRTLLATEVLGVILVSLLSVIVLVRLIVGDAPGDQTFNLDFLSLPKGTTLNTVATASVFGFVAFAGFEGAATLGEETDRPRRDIPRAITIAVVVAAIFFLLTIVAQTLGYGTSDSGVKAFASAPSSYGHLAGLYVGAGLADILNLAATISLLALAVSCLTGGGRILYALSRDSIGPENPLARTSAKTGAPVAALAICVVIFAGVVVAQRLNGTQILNATFYTLTVGTLSLLIAYFMATFGAIRYLFLTPTRKAPGREIAVPMIGLATLGLTLYKNTFGLQFPYNRFPIVVAIWLLVGVAMVVLSPGIASKVKAALGGFEANTQGADARDDLAEAPAIAR
jgi:amino acid transporter